ncbi:class I SAM-dependent methyltransferase [Pengzhenrongella frigida]|uniref:Class I SAM-dependent methyltransferase n=1 Tax=Pengzhenrongella frigida TaxID=1259133 RepID=A0A4Q5MVB6_9MICO|nr:class I SAM-dependent methyltransferase [Cellulomonas sp. HLT2-17]RYV49526.1 class I SAM-dependent methyltransferase [Cellulomonas sp. HLT2-17]
MPPTAPAEQGQLPATTYDELKRRAWAGRAEAYAETFGLLCALPIERLLDAALVAHGTNLLDAGTGTGAVAAAALGRGAHVTAVDPDPDMRRLARRSAPGAQVLDGALPELDLPDGAFDAVVANFVLNHVGDPLAGAQELARVARPGARVAVTVWPRPATELHRLWDDVVEHAGVAPVPAPPLAPASEFGRSPDGLGRLLTAAGLTNVQAATVRFVLRVDAEVWWSGPARGVASIGGIVEAQPPDVVARMKAHYDRLSRRYLAADGLLHLPTAVVLAHGQVR